MHVKKEEDAHSASDEVRDAEKRVREAEKLVAERTAALEAAQHGVREAEIKVCAE